MKEKLISQRKEFPKQTNPSEECRPYKKKVLESSGNLRKGDERTESPLSFFPPFILFGGPQ